jgi:hypothetical protein
MRCAGVDIFEGSKLVFEWRPAEGVADLLRLDMDVIVTAENDLP